MWGCRCRTLAMASTGRGHTATTACEYTHPSAYLCAYNTAHYSPSAGTRSSSEEDVMEYRLRLFPLDASEGPVG